MIQQLGERHLSPSPPSALTPPLSTPTPSQHRALPTEHAGLSTPAALSPTRPYQCNRRSARLSMPPPPTPPGWTCVPSVRTTHPHSSTQSPPHTECSTRKPSSSLQHLLPGASWNHGFAPAVSPPAGGSNTSCFHWAVRHTGVPPFPSAHGRVLLTQ